MDPDIVSNALEAASDVETARRTRRQVQPLRGVRGTPFGDIAKIAASTWERVHPKLPRDEDGLHHLFFTAWEDGLVAIGLLAAIVPDEPEEALELGLKWLEGTDDVLTADAIGWLILGPGSLAAHGNLTEVAAELRHNPREVARRAAIMMAMAALPEPLEGPSAAPLRARLGERVVQFVDKPRSFDIANLCTRYLRDEGVAVRKGIRRVIRAWADHDPYSVTKWAEGVKGGFPKILHEDLARAKKKAAKATKLAVESSEAGEE